MLMCIFITGYIEECVYYNMYTCLCIHRCCTLVDYIHDIYCLCYLHLVGYASLYMHGITSVTIATPNMDLYHARFNQDLLIASVSP